MSTRNVRQNIIAHFWGDFFDTQPYGRGSQREYIYKRYKRFVKNPAAHAAALIQEPLKVTTNRKCISRFFGEEVREYIETLNCMNLADSKILKDPDSHHNMIVLYLVNVEYILLHAELTKDEIRERIQKHIPYISKVLKVCCVNAVVRNIEDAFFEVKHPRLFGQYIRLFDSSRERFLEIEQRAKDDLTERLNKDGIPVKIQSRTKSISSLHKKIGKKNILPSQILDLIGLRVLVKTEDDCYRVLEILLDHWSVQHSRVKDYVAIPKENGYQSIHALGEFEGQKIEIQIRTNKMHHNAQYGQAAHRVYKSKK